MEEIQMRSKLFVSMLAAGLLSAFSGQVRAEEHQTRITVRVVHVAPPAPRVVVERVPAPAPDYVYTTGYWDYTNGGWLWVDGRWVAPPAASVTWVEPEYISVGDDYQYVPAHWSNEVVYDEHGKLWKHQKKLEKKLEKREKKLEKTIDKMEREEREH
jgi:hypothetical protein